MTKTKSAKPPFFFAKLFRLFFKQTMVSLICGALAFGAHNFAVKPFCVYADALGQALRYQIDFNQIKESGNGILQWLGSRFSQGTELNSYE